MNYLDLILGILLLLAAINGFAKGFVEELAGLIGLILGIWIAIHFSDIVANFLSENLHWDIKQLSIIAFIITFIIVVILVQIIGSVISKMVKAVHLGFLNRLAGVALGLAKGALILSVVLIIFNKIDKDVHIISQETRADSRLFEPIMNFAPGIFPFLDFWGENSKD